MMMTIKILPIFEFTFKMKALLHVYDSMEGGGRATQEQLPSSPVCSPGYVKSSLQRVLGNCSRRYSTSCFRAVVRSRYLCIHARQLTKGITIGQESRCREAQGCARTATSSFFHYANQANTTAWTQELERIRKTESRTTLHAVQLRILG